MRVAVIFFDASGNVVLVANVFAADSTIDGVTGPDIAATVRGQWADNCASAFAFTGPGDNQAYAYSAKP